MTTFTINSWKDIQAARSAATSAAREEAKEITWTGDRDHRTHRYGYIVSRGFVFYGYGIDGDTVLCGAECWEAPKTKADFTSAVEAIFTRYPEVVEVGIQVDYDGASSLHAYNVEGDYDPMISSADTGIVATRNCLQFDEIFSVVEDDDVREQLALDLRDPANGLHVAPYTGDLPNGSWTMGIRVVQNYDSVPDSKDVYALRRKINDAVKAVREASRKAFIARLRKDNRNPIFNGAVREALAQGYTVSVYDDDEGKYEKMSGFDDTLDLAYNLEMPNIRIEKDGVDGGQLSVIWNNGSTYGEDICDWTASIDYTDKPGWTRAPIDEILEPLCDKYSDEEK